MIRSTLPSRLVVLAFLLFAAPALTRAAAPRPPADPTSSSSCAINHAFADTASPVVSLILSGNFCEEPSVMIGELGGGLVDAVISFNDETSIEIDLGAAPALGTRVVLVECNRQVCFMDVALDSPPQLLAFDHSNLSISGGNTVSLESLANSSVGYDNVGRSLSVSDGSGTLSTSLAELAQTVSRSGLDVTLSNGGGTFSVADDDNDSGNELQGLSRSGLDLTLSRGGGSVSVADDDNDSGNELQDLSLSGRRLFISSGNSVDLPGDNLGNHTATRWLNMNDQAIANATTGAFGLGRFGNHNLSSRVPASNTAVTTAIFGSAEGSSGYRVGVYGRTESAGGFGVVSEGRFWSQGRVVLGDVPSASDSQALTIDGAGNVRKRSFPRGGTGYGFGLSDVSISPFTINGINWTCGGAGCTGGGAYQITDGTDVDFYVVGNGLVTSSIDWRTRVTNQGLDSETYRFSVASVGP